MFGYHTPYQVPDDVGFGSPLRTTEPAPQLFAFAMQAGEARVFVFTDDQDGREGLAMLMRSETVMKVVGGRELPCTSENRVVVRTPLDTWTDLSDRPTGA